MKAQRRIRSRHDRDEAARTGSRRGREFAGLFVALSAGIGGPSSEFAPKDSWWWTGSSVCLGKIILKTMAAIWAHACLLVDIWSIKLFVWALGRNGELLDSHMFFFDRYSDLADYHRLKGRTAKAERLAAIAEAHYQAAPGDDDDPETAAMAMPVPRPPLKTNAVSTTRMSKPPVGRPSGVMHSPAP